MFEITVVKFKEHPDSDYIGRGNILGNPFPITKTHTRDMVCDLYEKDFYERLRTDDGQYGNNSEFVNELRRLFKKGKEKGYLKLGCFCAPLRCHGDIIKEFFDKNQNLMLDYE